MSPVTPPPTTSTVLEISLGQGFERLRLQRPRDAHAQVVLGQHLRVFVVRLVAPGDVLAQIYALHHRAVIET